MEHRSKLIKMVLVGLAVKDMLPQDITQLDASVFDVVFDAPESYLDRHMLQNLPEWDEVEVHPCRCIDSDENIIEVCKAEEADFFSVYLHMNTGGLYCVQDFPDELQATTFADFILDIAIKYCPKQKQDD